MELPPPVLGKIESLFLRDPSTGECRILNPLFKELCERNVPWTASVKKDGSCGLLMTVNGKHGLYRRQDIDRKSRNYEHVSNTANGTFEVISGHRCYVTSMVRGTGRHEKYVPLYIFDLTVEGKLRVDAPHYVGFVEVDKIEDKYAYRALEASDNESDPYIWISESVKGCLELLVKRRKLSGVLLCSNSIISVEIMCRKLGDHYGLNDEVCCVSCHGSEEIPRVKLPNELRYDSMREWFENASVDSSVESSVESSVDSSVDSSVEPEWWNGEGIVIYMESGDRFKVHQGHFKRESEWHKRRECGLKFKFV